MKKLLITIEGKITNNLYNVFGCIGFWNSEGQHVYEQNKAGKMGNKFTQEQANKLPYEEFILMSLMQDFHTLTETMKGYKFGKGGTHIWIARETNNERVILINFTPCPR